MPLSEHEQRLLEQIEQALYAEDPKFASIYRGKDVRSHYRGRVIRATVGLVVGLGLLLAGVIVSIPLGVAGFIVMLASASYGVASWQRMTGQRAAAVQHDRRSPAGSRSRHRPRATAQLPKRSVVKRLEDRWQRRQDER